MARHSPVQRGLPGIQVMLSNDLLHTHTHTTTSIEMNYNFRTKLYCDMTSYLTKWSVFIIELIFTWACFRTLHLWSELVLPPRRFVQVFMDFAAGTLISFFFVFCHKHIVHRIRLYLHGTSSVSWGVSWAPQSIKTTPEAIVVCVASILCVFLWLSCFISQSKWVLYQSVFSPIH